MIRTCAVVFALTGLAAHTPAASPSSSPDPKTLAVPDEVQSKARGLVQQLGSEQFTEREQAEDELAKMGRLARAALLEGANSDPSAEVRSRCQTLLPKANTLEMRARLETFLADTEGKFEHDLPGWNQFRNLVRNDWSLFGHHLYADRSLDRPARVVFADLISTPANRHVMLAVGGQAGVDLGPLAAARRQELYNQRNPRAVVVGGMIVRPAQPRNPTTADIATLLFAESQVGPKYFPPRTASVSLLISSSGFTTAARGEDDAGKVHRAIAVAWLQTRTEPIDMSNAMTIASNLNLPGEACRVAVRLFESKGATVYYRGNAAATLARLGDKSHIPMLERAQADETVLTTIRKAVPGKPVAEWDTFEIQIRDVALAVAITLAGQKPEDYGFVDQYKANGSAATAFNYTRYYLTTEDRKAAFAKWKEWRAKNP